MTLRAIDAAGSIAFGPAKLKKSGGTWKLTVAGSAFQTFGQYTFDLSAVDKSGNSTGFTHAKSWFFTVTCQ